MKYDIACLDWPGLHINRKMVAKPSRVGYLLSEGFNISWDSLDGIRLSSQSGGTYFVDRSTQGGRKSQNAVC